MNAWRIWKARILRRLGRWLIPDRSLRIWFASK